eukprot:6192063-Pleurochrysis_carterae.AAC.1
MRSCLPRPPRAPPSLPRTGPNRAPGRSRRGRARSRALAAAAASGAPWAIENPADCGDRGCVARWDRFADHAPLWVLPAMRDALGAAGAERVAFAHVVRAGGSDAQVHHDSIRERPAERAR